VYGKISQGSAISKIFGMGVAELVKITRRICQLLTADSDSL